MKFAQKMVSMPKNLLQHASVWPGRATKSFIALGFGILGLAAASSAHANAIYVNLGTASSFAVLAGSTVTNTGTTNIGGNVGVAPGTAITGFASVVMTGGSTYAADAVATQAQFDLATAYNFAAGEVSTTNLSGQNLGGLTLTPGVYNFTSSAQLTGTLTLNALGNPNAVFLFQIGSTLTTASNSVVDFINGGQGSNTFFQVGSSATLGTTTSFAGNILALTSITLDTGANITCGSALARNGAVTLSANNVSINSAACSAASVPEPASFVLLGISLIGFGLLARPSAMAGLATAATILRPV